MEHAIKLRRIPLSRTHHIKRSSKCVIFALAIALVIFNTATILPILNINHQPNEKTESRQFENNPPQKIIVIVNDTNPEDPETLAHRTYSTFSAIPLSGPFEDQQLGYYSSREWQHHWIEGHALSPKLLTAIQTDLNENLPLRFDHVYTWVNGSDPLLVPMRRYYQGLSPVYKSYLTRRWRRSLSKRRGNNKDSIAKRFRDLDELRYSIRSVAMHGMSFLRRIHLFTTNVAQSPAEGNSSDPQHDAYTTISQTAGQVPQWLDTRALASRHDFCITHHANVFEKVDHLPTFNSLAIESQLYRLPDLSDIFVYMNDDTFYNRPLSQVDIWTPLYGFVFHFQSSLVVAPSKPHPDYTSADLLALVDGEWNSLHYSNFLLSKQFGPRARAYVAHISHVLSKSILQEMATIWPDEVLTTSSHRFRGEGEGQDIHTTFMMAHYVAERLRETQLRSFWEHVLDADQDGFLSWDERRWLVDKVKVWNAYQQEQLTRHQAEEWVPIRQNHSRPLFVEGADAKLNNAGFVWHGSTAYKVSGMDGYPHMHRGANTSHPLTHTDSNGKNIQPTSYEYESAYERTCTLDLDFCMGTQFSDPIVETLDASQLGVIFDRVAFQHYHCGDCLLHLLLQHADLGLEGGILPKDKSSPEYMRVVRDLARYNYVVGTANYEFVTLQSSPWLNQATLNKLTAAGDRNAFFCVNDNMPDTPDVETHTKPMLQRFFNTRFPTPSPWERQEATHTQPPTSA